MIIFYKELVIRTYTIFSIFTIFGFFSLLFFLLLFHENNSVDFSNNSLKITKLSNFAYSTKEYNIRFKDYNTYKKDLYDLNFKSSYSDFVYAN